MAEITKADVINFIENMSVLELAEMVKELKRNSVYPQPLP